MDPSSTSTPAATGRVEYLDVYRGLASLLIFFYHTGVNLSLFGVPFPGYNGVHLFFVLSGYLMAGKFLPALLGTNPPPGLRDYLSRRFLRIYPPYFVCLLLFVALRVFSGTNPPDWQNILLRAGLVFNYVDHYDYFAINNGLWTLAIEIQFYLLLPLIAWLCLRCLRPRQSRALMFAVSFLVVGILSRAFESSFIDHTGANAIAVIRFKWVTSHLDLFGAGILLKVVEEFLARRPFSLTRLGATGGMLAGATVLALVALWTRAAGHWQDSPDLFFVSLGPTVTCLAFALLLGVTGASPLRESRLFRSALLVWVGQVSYSMYLYHPGVFYAFDRIFRPDRWGLSWGAMTLLTGLCCLPIALAVAWLGYRFIELPFHRPRCAPLMARA